MDGPSSPVQAQQLERGNGKDRVSIGKRERWYKVHEMQCPKHWLFAVFFSWRGLYY